MAKAKAAAEAAEQAFGPNDSRTAAALLSLGTRQAGASDLQDAELTLQRAVRIAVAAADRLLEASVRLQLADTLSELADHQNAVAEADRGLRLRRDALPAGEVAIAAAVHVAGSVQAMADASMAELRFEPDAAIKRLRDAVAEAVRAHGTDDRTTGRLQQQLGEVLLRSGHRDAARIVLETVLAAQRRTLGAEHVRTFTTELSMVRALAPLADPRSTLADLERLAEVAKRRFGDNHANVFAVHRLRANAMHALGDHDAALASLAASRRPTDVDPEQERRSDFVLVTLLAATGRSTEAAALATRLAASIPDDDPQVFVHETTQLAEVFAKVGMQTEAIELLRESLQNDRWTVAWGTSALQCRDLLARLLDESGHDHEAAVLDAETLGAISTALDRTLPSLLASERLHHQQAVQNALDRLLRITADHPQALPIATVVQAVLGWKSVVARDLERELTRWRHGNDDERPRIDRLHQVLRTMSERLHAGLAPDGAWRLLSQERDALLRALAKVQRVAEGPITETAVAAALSPADVLVEFVRWRQGSEAKLTAFVRRAGEAPTRIELGALAPIHQALTAHLQLLARSIRPLDATSRRLAETATRRLSQLVLEPIEPSLTGCLRVFFATDGELALLPFDSLKATAGTFLLESHDVRHLRSGADLVTTKRPRGKGLLVVDGSAADLPGPSQEAGSIAALWERAQRGPVLHRRADQLVDVAEDMRGREFLHVAAHGRGPKTTGAQPANAAASGSSAQLANASLRASEMTFFDLSQCRLIVLSACDTGIGNALPGEHLIGMRRALRLAGAQQSLTALWQIEDAAARDLMVAFWRELLRCDDPAQALRTAKLGQLADNRRQHGDAMPGTWAAFLLDGN